MLKIENSYMDKQGEFLVKGKSLKSNFLHTRNLYGKLTQNLVDSRLISLLDGKL